MAKKIKNKIILCCSTKGGVGKSVLCGMLSTYLLEEGNPVAVLDADVQLSVYRHRQRELQQHPDADIPWQVEPLDTSNPEFVRNMMEKLKSMEGCVVIDCPGNIIDPTLRIIYEAADIALVPFRYDSDTVDATEMFAKIFKQICTAKVFFVPNNIVIVEERGQASEAERKNAVKILRKYGFVTPRIKQSKVVRNYSTLDPLNYYQRNAVKFAFEPIIKLIKQ